MPEAGRVIAGAAAGRRLLAPGPGTRPFSDRVKQALFAILEPDLDGASVLDLFAGSGAGGIEALSRGARRAVFVEHHAGAADVIRSNLRRTGLTAGAQVVRAESLNWLRSAAGQEPSPPPAEDGPSGSAPPGVQADESGSGGPFDIVLIDPPYAETELVGRTLQVLADAGARLLTADARVVAKHFWRDRPPERVGLLAAERERRFGETGLTFYRVEAGAGRGTGCVGSASREQRADVAARGRAGGGSGSGGRRRRDAGPAEEGA